MLTLAFGIATAYFELWDSDKHNWYDLWSWSCVKGNSRSGTYQDQLDFHGLCRKMRGVWYLALAITGVELGAVVCCIWAVVVSGKSYWKVASGQEEDRERRGERWYGE